MKDLVEFPLKFLNGLGYLQANTNAKNVVLLIIWQVSLAFSFGASILNHFYSNNIFEMTNNFQGASALCQVFGHLTACVCQKKKYLNVLEQRKRFWNTDGCSKSTTATVSRISNIVAFLQKSFLLTSAIIVLGFMVPSSIFERKLPSAGTFNVSDDPRAYYTVWVTSAISIVAGGCGLINVSSLFLGLCYEGVMQFKIFNDHLERLSVDDINSEDELEDFFNKFKHLMEHHKFLLRYIRAVGDCFNVIFLIQFLTTSAICCTFTYATFESPAIVDKIASAVPNADAICQFAIYCISATYMRDEASKTAHAIYNSNWYAKHFNKLKKSTQLMIQEAQQEIEITTLGGIVDINPKLLITVLRTSFSICTVLRNIKK